MSKQIDGQLNLWDILSAEAPEEEVEIKGAVNLKAHPISNYEVRLAYGDLVLLVAMVEDYIKGLDVIKADDIQWQVYYRNKFKKISNNIQEQIEYDYQKAFEKCIKKKDKDSDIGEEAMALAIKYAPKPKKKETPDQEKTDTENKGDLK